MIINTRVKKINWCLILLYEELLLRKNLVPKPPFDAALYFERLELKSKVDQFLLSLFKTKSKVQVVIYGPHQSGKSHLLAFLRDRIFHEGQVLCIEVDFVFAHSPFQLYLQIVDSMLRNGCIDSFLKAITGPEDLSKIITIAGGSSVVSTVFLRVGRDPLKLRDWMTGNLQKQGESWLPNIKDSWIEIDVITNLMRFYYAESQQLYPVLIADHCEVLVDDLVAYINEDMKVRMAKLLSCMMDLSSFFVSIDSAKIDDFNRILYPKIAAYDNIEVPPMQRRDIQEFIIDVRNTFADLTKTKTFSEIKNDEHLTSETYPLTQEAEAFILDMFPLEPGKLVRILQGALDRSVQNNQEYLITKKDVEETILANFPTLFFKCNQCHARLKLLTIETRSSGVGRLPPIEKMACSQCGADLSSLAHFVPSILTSMVLDSSSLAGLDFSSLCNWVPSLKTKRIKVLIPNAVLSEISAWDKKPEKRGISRLARQEYQMLVHLDSIGGIHLLCDVGRRPTIAEIKEATSFNSIDRIIIDVAQVNDATLITHDQDMAANSLKKARFTILFKTR
jgi:Cdc6-like AAA superfamily ATPase